MGRWGDGEMGRWGDGEMGRWGDGECGEMGSVGSELAIHMRQALPMSDYIKTIIALVPNKFSNHPTPYSLLPTPYSLLPNNNKDFRVQEFS